MTAPLVGAVGLVSLAVVATAFIDSALVILLLLGAAGLGISVLSTVSQTLLQRTVPAHLIGRVFGVIEGLSGVGLAVGSLLVPLLIQLGGARAALICTAAVLPLAALLGARALKSLDAAARVPVVEIALFRSLPHFRVLPTPELEGLSHAAVRMEFGHGEKIIVQGETGDLFYAISEGDVSIFVDGVQVATRKRPEGLGEIALLHNRPRSATAVAHGTVVLYALDGDTFISVVTGHDATRRRAEAVATARLSGHQSDPE